MFARPRNTVQAAGLGLIPVSIISKTSILSKANRMMLSVQREVIQNTIKIPTKQNGALNPPINYCSKPKSFLLHEKGPRMLVHNLKKLEKMIILKLRIFGISSNLKIVIRGVPLFATKRPFKHWQSHPVALLTLLLLLLMR